MAGPGRLTRLALALALGVACAAPPVPEPCDLLIVGGTVVDGTGAPGRRADVLVRDGRVLRVAVVDRSRVAAARIVDAGGLVVAPGFVDAHAHGDPLRSPGLDSFAAMGVTTVCLGQDGTSPAADVGGWLAAVARRRPALNVATQVGHRTVRRLAGVEDGAAPEAVGLLRMQELIAAAMEAGALGLSTGLEYTPGRFATPEELLAVARPVAARDGVVASHVRSEDDGAVEAAVQELLDQCLAAGCRAHLSHAKVVLGHGVGRAEAVLDRLARARAAGLAVTADVYPYLASFTGLGILFPPWALPPNDYAAVAAGRRAELAAFLRDRVAARNGPAAMRFGSGPWAGQTLAEAAGGEPYEELLVDLGPDGASAAYFVMAPEVVDRFARDPFVAFASDGSPTMRHPRGHGTFARVIRDLVVERAVLTLEEAVRRMTSLPAAALGLADRGMLAAGHAADLVVFDPRSVRDLATYEAPFRPAAGFDLVVVNGVPVRDGGRPTGARPGLVLRRAGADRPADPAASTR